VVKIQENRSGAAGGKAVGDFGTAADPFDGGARGRHGRFAADLTRRNLQPLPAWVG
jgi:hypothetical protein